MQQAEILTSSSYTDHTQRRQRQRGIPASVVEALWEYGRVTHDHHGAEIVYFDKRARQRLARDVPHQEYARIERHLNVYAVVAVDDGNVVTLRHRCRRILQH